MSGGPEPGRGNQSRRSPAQRGTKTRLGRPTTRPTRMGPVATPAKRPAILFRRSALFSFNRRCWPHTQRSGNTKIGKQGYFERWLRVLAKVDKSASWGRTASGNNCMDSCASHRARQSQIWSFASRMRPETLAREGNEGRRGAVRGGGARRGLVLARLPSPRR